jgi:hypothetical protein
MNRRLLGKTSSERTHSRDKFLHRERLREVVIRAESETGHAIAHLATRGQDKDASRHFRRAQTSQHFEAVHSWQHHVQHDEIVLLRLRFAQGGFAVMQHSWFVASFSQSARDMVGKANFIFDD